MEARAPIQVVGKEKREVEGKEDTVPKDNIDAPKDVAGAKKAEGEPEQTNKKGAGEKVPPYKQEANRATKTELLDMVEQLKSMNEKGSKKERG